jgi:hypothetical protein
MKPNFRRQSPLPGCKSDKSHRVIQVRPVLRLNLMLPTDPRQPTAEVQMNTENECRFPGDYVGDSGHEATALEKENENGCPDSAPSESKTFELLKAMNYFVLSRL